MILQINRELNVKRFPAISKLLKLALSYTKYREDE